MRNLAVVCGKLGANCAYVNIFLWGDGIPHPEPILKNAMDHRVPMRLCQ